ncbi:hypothetical protein Lbir_1051 [Legionella birminghamensis]|uniref:Ulp1 protease family, C-terminal catalytic domain n=1 Tax=Legionella birminghamensis TaxID=28083 RepID=A0A378I6T3_9GAMM|nr:Ulp1 family isopeptidase [Legionella birminghamensis]KTC73789.1 hypothetical protein Lbir_1051 [Legionella birminghamensis]STX30713.1 Ulp1 protease family, C-terminal catalytic domain [Legionella birminghamensis]
MPGSEPSNNKRHSTGEQSSNKRQKSDKHSAASTQRWSIDQSFRNLAELVKKNPSPDEKRFFSDNLANIEHILTTTRDLHNLQFENASVSTNLSKFISNLRELINGGYPVSSFPTALIVKILESILREENPTAYSLTTILSSLGSTLQRVIDQNIPADLIERVVVKAVKLHADYRALKACIMGISQLNEHNRIDGQIHARSLQEILPLVKWREDNTIITSVLCELLKNLRKNEKLSGNVSAYQISHCLAHFTLSSRNEYNANTHDKFGKKSRSFIFNNLKTLGDYKCITDSFEMEDLIHVLKEFLHYPEYDNYIGNYVYYLGTLASQGHILGRALVADLMKCLKTISSNSDSLGLALYGIGFLSDNNAIKGRISLDEIYQYFIKQKTLQRVSQGMVALGFLSRDNMLFGNLPLAPLIAFITPFLGSNTVADENPAHSYVSILVNLQEILKKGSFEGKVPLGFIKKIFTELLKNWTTKQLGMALTMLNELLIRGYISQWEGAWLNALLMERRISQHINYEANRDEAISIFSALAQISENYFNFDRLLFDLAERILLTEHMDIEDALEFLDSAKLLAQKDIKYLPYFLRTLNLIPAYSDLDEEYQDLIEVLAEDLRQAPHLQELMQEKLKIPPGKITRFAAPTASLSTRERRSSGLNPRNPPSREGRLEADDISLPMGSAEYQSAIVNETMLEDGEVSLPRPPRESSSTTINTRDIIRTSNRPGFDLYTAISNHRKAELCTLLGIEDKVYLRKFRRVRQTPGGNNSSPHEDLPPTNSEDLVFAFFTLDNDILSDLIRNIENADYLLALFDACSIKKRFELAKNTPCIPLIIQNFHSLAELTRFVKILTFEFQYYRDHRAVLQLNDELTARRRKNPGEANQLLVLQKIFLKRALRNHLNHNHVRPRIEDALAAVQNELDKLPQPAPTAPVVNQSSFFRQPPPSFRKPLRRIESPPQETPIPEKPARPERPMGLARVKINCNYFYETEDIQAILTARINHLLAQQPSLPRVSVIACSQLNQQGNNIANVLFNYLEYESLGDSETLLIPIQDHMHWVGLRVDIRDKAIVKVSYFDSNRGENYDYREDERYEEIRKQLRENNFIGNEEELTIPPRCMQQPDGSSCGAWLIENFYCDLKGQWYRPEPQAAVIRKLHLDTLYSERRDYYASFAPRQASGRSSMPSENDQRNAHGLKR